jgi:broad specificity phosphatase PhoE
MIYLVRHGRASAGWDTHLDPDLDELGRSQAAQVAEQLAPLGPMELVSSPLQRCLSTALPLATLWGIEAVVEPAVAEIPSPPGVSMPDRVEWLRAAMAGTWNDLASPYLEFRDAVVERVASCEVDTVIFSHFIAINAVIGACTGDDRLVIRRLDNCSVTSVDRLETGLVLVEGGHEADTLIR